MYDLKVRLVSDTTPDKVDLGAGVYRDEVGRYYELPVIRKAKNILESQPPDHDYGGHTGDPKFVKLASEVIFGKDSETLKAGKVASSLTIAGTGAVHIGAVFASRFFATPGTPLNVYIGVPAWGNYNPLFAHAGLNPITYNYYDAKQKRVDFATLLSTIAAAPPRSVFVLQGVCHNPTGLDLTNEEWIQVADALALGGHLPFFDVAYQGFGVGLDEDAWAVREFVRRGQEVIVAQSFSKNLGLYGERVGVVHVVTGDAGTAKNVADQLRCFARWDYSSPPRYGATLANIVLENFWDEWLENLKTMRERLQQTRKHLHRLLTEELKTPGNWEHILYETGLFSLLALNEAQVKRIGSEFHIHFPTNGRINVAGLNEAKTERLARAIDSVLR
ncbi:hypothetical protein GTA08_BOTSDO04420 [Neofusicoccum parvum]|uniref:Uncharacterized protein n=2 Tax=Neofusicoccum parvum TaxID=310453 RepID=A0ACB5S0Z2_9PEZI|nr:hypothetical protein GTA08_BOTSDO04420 [Neofusicoccum parvum]